MPTSRVAQTKPATNGTLHLRLCHVPEVVRPDGGPVALAPRDAALLAWLALEGPTPRARMASLLWPDSAPEAARNTLRQRLYQLRRQYENALIDGQTHLALGRTVTHDLHGSEGLLEGNAVEIAGEYGQWLAQQRERRRSRTRQGLAARAEDAEAAQDWPAALALAQDLLALQPLSEEAHQRLMRLHYLAGDRAAALLAFDRCEKLLKDEIGARPSAATLVLLATVEGNGSAAAPPPPLAGVPPSVLRPPRLFGRDAQVLALAEGWAAAQVVALIGEAGMGKSRLFQEFAALHPGTVHVAARPGDMGVPFATLARLLRAVAALPQATALLQREPATRSEVARVVPELAGGGAAVAGEGQRLVLQGALARLLHTQPALAGLLVDDLHFADEASLEMLLALLGEEPAQGPGSGPRWALAWRPAEAGTPLHGFADALAEQAALRPVLLLPLSEADLAALVDSLGLPAVRGAALAAGLHQRTGGNPLFVLETLKQAWVEGQLRGDSAATGSTALALPRPASVTRLIERRVAQLSAGALALARVAAIAGVDFGVPLAEHVLQVPAMRLADAITELEAAQVLRGNQFAHDLVADTVHGGVPATVAQHTHAQVAQWLQTHGGEPARVAGHWILAAQPLQALPWLQQTADAARGAVRHREYIHFLETKARIEENAGHLEAAFESLLPAVEERTCIGQAPADCLAACDHLDRLARTTRQRVQAGLLRTGVHAHNGNPAGIATGQATLAAALALGEEQLIMHTHSALAQAYTVADDSARALHHERQCMAWFEAHGSLLERANGHGGLALALDNLGQGEAALPHHARAMALALQAGDVQQASVAAANHARNRVSAGDLVLADQSFAQSEQLLGAYEHQASHLPMVRLLRAMVLCQLGRYEEALDHTERALETTQTRRTGHLELAQLRLAACWWQLGQWARLKQTLALVVPDPAKTSMAVRVGHARLNWYYTLAQGAPRLARRQALQPLRDALAAVPADKRPDLRLPLLLDLAGTSEDLDTAAPLQQARAVAEQAAALGYRNVELAARLRAAEFATATDPRQARREALAALELHRRGVQTTALLPAATWLHTAQALAAAGDRAHATEVTAEGRAWLQDIAVRHVATPWRQGFLEHNPVNHELLALASRLC
jgi:DNA-binding SARP family transcriptional activator